jgi:hypothetical protein
MPVKELNVTTGPVVGKLEAVKLADDWLPLRLLNVRLAGLKLYPLRKGVTP